MIYPVSIARNTATGAPGNTSFAGGLSAESVDIAGENATDLIKDTNDSARDIGGLSAESVDIAGEN